MSSQRYERVSDNDLDDVPVTPTDPQSPRQIPSSPPPSFRSRNSSPSSRRLLSHEDPITSDAERTLNDAFDDGSDSDGEGREGDDRQRLIRNTTARVTNDPRIVDDGGRPEIQRAVTSLPPSDAIGGHGANLRTYGSGAPSSNLSHSNDGVFANLNAKPERGEKIEEQPPSYEVAAADATPPYWETTILAPNHLSATDEVYVDGLPVGSAFSFIWNAMISMSFSLVGFLLTYLLHTTHAAKNGSRAGLGVTLVRYGFMIRSGTSKSPAPSMDDGDTSLEPPQDPNSHDFDPSQMSDSTAAAAAAAAISQGSQQASTSSSSGLSSVAGSNWLAYALMIVGWFILIRAVSDFFRARKHEDLVLRSPDRGLNVPVIADNERPEGVV